MKRRLFVYSAVCVVCLFLTTPEPVSASQPESRLYGELRSTMQSGAWPQAVTLSDQLLKTYPLTLYKESVCLMKGESLCRLGRFSESIEVLTPYTGKNYQAAYWTGRSWLELHEFQRAANYFQAAIILMQLQNADDERLLQSSYVYGAHALASSGDDVHTAIRLLEYAFETWGITPELQRGLVLLYSLYSRTDSWEKTVSLYDQTESLVQQLPEVTRDSVLASVITAYGRLGIEDELQWTMCLSLLESEQEETVLSALSYAYRLAETSDRYDVAQVLDKAEPFLIKRSQWRSELWLRLGREECLAGDCEKALDFYSRALSTADSEQKGSIYLFMADCYRQSGNQLKMREALKAGLMLDTPYAIDCTLALLQDYLFHDETADAFACRDRLWQLYTLYPKYTLGLTALFYHAYLYALQDDWNTVYRELYPIVTEDQDACIPEVLLLYAQSLMKRSSYTSSETMNQVEKLFLNAVQALDGSENQTAARQNLAVLLLHQKRYGAAYTTARTESALGYIAGLGAVGTGNWQSAANLLGTDTPWGLYYTAYALYQSGSTLESQALFSRFARENPDHVQCRSAWHYVALSAVQNGDSKNALLAAEKWYRLSVNESQKTESALLWAELYAADRQYDKAVALLEPMAKARTAAAVPVRFSLADLYTAAGNTAAAAKLLLETQSVYFDDTVKEEALYRLAELYFRQGKYTDAASRFDACRKNYPSGVHARQALYYNALCLDRIGDRASRESAVLLYTMVTQGSGNTPYLFASWARLAMLNRELGFYEQSLEAIEQAVRLSPKEAATLGLGDLKKQVILLQNGEEEQVVQLVTDYEQNGRERTEKGRAIGVQLARLYLSNGETRQQGFAVLKDVTDSIPKRSPNVGDRKTAAAAWNLLGTWQRQELLLADSVDSYITSAEFWAGIDTAAQEEQLFNAIKSLYELGRMADSAAVLKTMKDIDADSAWVTQAESLLDDYFEY